MDRAIFFEAATIPYEQLFTIGEYEVLESETNTHLNPSSSHSYEFLNKDIHFTRIMSHDERVEVRSFKSIRPYISIVCSFKGKYIFSNRSTAQSFADIRSNQGGIVYVNNHVTDTYWAAQAGAEMFIINVTIDYFKRFIPQDHPLFDMLHSCLEENTPVLLGERVLDISPKMKTLLYDIFQCDYTGHYKTLFLKSKFIELLLLQFQEYETEVYKQSPVVDQVNLAKMQEAKEIIDTNLERPCSLVDLALKVGTNECYLKKHFKQAFGITVFGYLHQQRMEQSKQLLFNNDVKIAEVAKRSGYKHASHFSTAFKKYFGYLPNQVR